MLEDVLGALKCPKGEPSLRRDGSSLVCDAGHRFDIARQGYVNLLAGPAPAAADTAAMVAARMRIHAAGILAAVTDALVGAVTGARASGAGLGRDAGETIVDLGAGTGHHLAAVLEATDAPSGLAVDVSKHAARRAARAHPRIGAVVADVWERLPIRTQAASVVLDVFSPRNIPEVARLLRPDGVFVVVTPARGHLDPLPASLGLLGIEPGKTARLDREVGMIGVLTARREVTARVEVASDLVADVARMGPSAHHLEASFDDDVRRLVAGRSAIEVAIAATLSVYRRRETAEEAPTFRG